MIAPMAIPLEPAPRVDIARYFALVDEGVIAAEERVELLDGVVVAMSPQSPLHAAGVRRVERRLREALPAHVLFCIQMPLLAGATSVPEPDVAVVAGEEADYVDRHPSSALLVVEVAVSSSAQDRFTKARIYAGANVPAYWIVNLTDEVVEAFSDPDPPNHRYRSVERRSGQQELLLAAFPGVSIPASDLIPRRAS